MAKTLLNYPVGIGLDEANYPAWVKFDIYERQNPANSIPLRTINLFLPERLNNPNTVSWDTERMGFLGSTIKNAVNNGVTGSGLWSSATDAGKIMASQAVYKGLEELVRGGGGRANSDQLQGALTGQVRNPFLTMFFRGVDFRTFEMQFKFCPHTLEDCTIIDDIITEFRANAVPAGSGQPAFLGYPNEFQLTYMWRGNENKYLHKFKRCALTGVDVDYTSAGMWAVMRNGFPAETLMTLKFSEIDLVLRDDIRNGY